MLEHAGRSLAEVALRSLPGPLSGATVVVLAGSGGNGAGGICAARHLAAREVDTMVCYGDPERLGEAARGQRSLFAHTSGREVTPAFLVRCEPDLIIDALIGYGLSSAPRGDTAALMEWANGQSCAIASLDLPSGVDATTGDRPGLAITPATTVTLALPKTGLSRGGAGEILLADLGIPAETYRRAGIAVPPLFDRRFVVPIALYR
jgi:NAD(P)H-hydrate epimerase